MNKTRTIIKKLIYKTFGEGVYAKAYAKGKIKDINRGVLDEKESNYLKHFIKKDSTVLDIGANYGHYAIDMSRICKEGKVYAFEPIPFTFKVLKSITKHFKTENIILEHAAVSNTAGTIEMTLPLLDFGAPNTGIAFIGGEDGGTSEPVKVKTLKIDNYDIQGRIDFIKIDIEGHEPQAFQGMEGLIKQNRPVILIEFSFPCLKRGNTNPVDFAHYLQNKLNYTFAAVGEKGLEIIEGSQPSDGYYFLLPTEKLDVFKNTKVL